MGVRSKPEVLAGMSIATPDGRRYFELQVNYTDINSGATVCHKWFGRSLKEAVKWLKKYGA